MIDRGQVVALRAGAGLILLLALMAPAAANAVPDTTVGGWRVATLSLAPDVTATFQVVVRTRGQRVARSVRLQERRIGERAWRNGPWRRTSARGVARLTWVAPARQGSFALRLVVRRSGAAGRAVTATRSIDVGTRSASAPGQPITIPTPTPTPTPTPVSTPVPLPIAVPTPSVPDYAQDVVRLTNEARSTARTCGSTAYPAVPPLVAEPRLRAAAQAHASDMATTNHLSHISTEGRSPGERIAAVGYVGSAYGENIAAGYPKPESVIQGWLASPGHCANLMSSMFTQLGVGYANSGPSQKMFWVQNFGRPG